MAKNIALLAKLTTMKGFFKKTPSGEYLVVALHDGSENMFIAIQFLQVVKPGTYVIAIVGAGQSADQEVIDSYFDSIRYHAQFQILEDKLGVNVKHSSKGISITFKSPSKYIGKTLDLFSDSRLPQGYFLGKCKMKKDFEPAQQFKLGSGAIDLGDVKKMRAFTSSKLKGILTQKLRQ